MFEDTNDFKNIFVSISELHDLSTDQQSVLLQDKWSYREGGLFRGLYSDTAECNGFINAKLGIL